MELKTRQWLLALARRSIREILTRDAIADSEVPEEAKATRASFVTLHKHGALRGCIGSLIASKPLHLDVREHAIDAALHDMRFPQVTLAEMDELDIEISVIGLPVQLHYRDGEDLIRQLATRPGVILSWRGQSATFLPQVWGHLPNPVDFLTELCRKAGIPHDEWRRLVEVHVYTVEAFSEAECRVADDGAGVAARLGARRPRE